MRIAILSPYDGVLAFMDTDLPEAMHFYDDNLHTYRFGLAYTFDFKALTSHPDSQFLKEGNKLAFVYEDISYYLTIVQVIRNAKETSVTAQSLTLELLNEEVDAVDSPKVMTALEYINDLHFESDVLRVGINEVPDQKLRLKFESKETIISRLYAIAQAFGAEAEFQVHLKRNYALDRIDLNLKKAGTLMGVGSDRTASVIRYGNEVSGIEKEADISELTTGIRARGRKAKSKRTVEKTEGKLNGKVVRVITKTTLEEDKRKEVRTVTLIRDPEGILPDYQRVHIKVEYIEDDKVSSVEKELTNGQKQPFLPSQLSETTTVQSEAEETEKVMTLVDFGITSVSDENGVYILDAGGDLRAPDARNRYPSSLKTGSDGITFADGYIFRYYEDTSAEDQIELFNGALKELKESCIPKIKYTIKGYVQGSVGDWLMIEDAQYDPAMYVRCRIVEQEKSLIRPYEGTTTVDNFTEFSSRIDQSVAGRINQAIEASRLYDVTISSSFGTVFKQDDGPAEYQAVVRRDGIDIGDQMSVRWEFEGQSGDSRTFTIDPAAFDQTARLTCTVTDRSGRYRGSAEVTLQKIDLPTISQEANEDGSLTIKTESAGVTNTQTLAKGKDGISPTTSLIKSGKVTTFTVNDAAGTHSVQIHDGSDGQSIQGPPGDAGVGISGISKMYVRSSSYTVQPTSGWSTVPGTLTATFPYMWERMAVSMTDGSTSYIYSVCAVRGSDGSDGSPGAAGVGISSITMKYYQSSSSTTPSQTSSSWSTTLPYPTAGYYLHTQIQITKTDGTSSYFYQRVRNGTNGSGGSSTTIIDNLTSTSTTSALSANQGRILSNTVRLLDQAIVIDLTSTATNYLDNIAADVLEAIRRGFTPLIWNGSAYAMTIYSKIEYICGGWQITLYYYEMQCGFANLTTITLNAPFTCTAAPIA